MRSLALRDLASIGIDRQTYWRAQKFYADRGIMLTRQARIGWIMSKIGGDGNGDCFVTRHTFGLDYLADVVFDAPSVALADFLTNENPTEKHNGSSLPS